MVKSKISYKDRMYASPYILFSINERPRVVKESPNMDAKDIFAEIGKRWNNLSNSERSFYERKSNKIKKG